MITNQQYKRLMNALRSDAADDKAQFKKPRKAFKKAKKFARQASKAAQSGLQAQGADS
jgi:hypothetical protein